VVIKGHVLYLAAYLRKILNLGVTNAGLGDSRIAVI
jgi:hypothetical protein